MERSPITFGSKSCRDSILPRVKALLSSCSCLQYLTRFSYILAYVFHHIVPQILLWGLCTSGPPAWHTPPHLGCLAFKPPSLVPFPVWFLLTLPSDSSLFLLCAVYTHRHACTGMGRPAATVRHLPQLLCIIFLRWGLSLKLGLTGLARLAGQRAPAVPPVSTFPVLGLQVHALCLAFYVLGT